MDPRIIQSVANHARGGKLPEGMFCSVLTPGEKPLVNSLDALKNSALLNTTVDAMGYKVDINTLTYIRQQVIDQIFYEIAPAEVMPVDVGTGAFMSELLTYSTFSTGADFEAGDIEVSSSSKIAEVDTGIAPIKSYIKDWAKQLGYSLFDVEKAARSGNWSIIESKEKARKMNWDLGVQRVSFLGHKTDTNIKGLLNLAVNSNTDLINGPIKDMNSSDFAALVAGILGAYNANASSTMKPDTFVIPLSDYLGLAAPTNEDFTIVSKLDYLLKAFRSYIPNFKIEGVAYCDQTENNLSVNRYALYKRTPDNLSSFIPLNYTSTLVGSYNNFQFQSVGYGQYGGVTVFRSGSVLYFDYANTP